MWTAPFHVLIMSGIVISHSHSTMEIGARQTILQYWNEIGLQVMDIETIIAVVQG